LKPDTTGVLVGTTGKYEIMGSNVDRVVSVFYGGTSLPFRYTADKSVLTIDALPPTLAANPGTVNLLIVASDGTTQEYPVAVKAKP
jgi:hypothetical protein